MRTVEAPERAAQVLATRPAALVSDIDGTLSPIAPSPEEAYVLPECRAALKALATRLDLVAVLSGRPAEQARLMVALDELLYVGNHGLELWDQVRGYRSEATAYEAETARIFRRLENEIESIQGVRLENKETVIAIHYRASSQPDDARRKILDAATRVLAGTTFTVREGKKVVELRPPMAADKGTVVTSLVEGVSAQEHRLYRRRPDRRRRHQEGQRAAPAGNGRRPDPGRDRRRDAGGTDCRGRRPTARAQRRGRLSACAVNSVSPTHRLKSPEGIIQQE